MSYESNGSGLCMQCGFRKSHHLYTELECPVILKTDSDIPIDTLAEQDAFIAKAIRMGFVPGPNGLKL